MIVAFLLEPSKWYKPNWAYVVNNPLDWSLSYCLPVAVIAYAPGKPPPVFRNHPTVPIEWDEVQAGEAPKRIAPSVPPSKWLAPWRWSWAMDGGKFEPYNDEFNRVIESAYELYTAGRGPPQFTTPPLVRYVDDTPQAYHIDFVALQQRNAKTRYVRRIQRNRVPCSNERIWEFFDEHGVWREYESLVQDKLEAAFTAYASSSGASSVTVNFPGRPEAYTVSFVEGRQTNTVTGETRNVRRQ